MSEVEDVKPHLTPEGKFALVVIFGELFVFIPFAFLGHPDLGFGACISGAMTAIAVRSKWSSHRNQLFWPAAALSLLLQIPLVLFYPWNKRDLRPLLLPLGIFEYAIVWVCIEMAVKCKPSQKDSGSR